MVKENHRLVGWGGVGLGVSREKDGTADSDSIRGWCWWDVGEKMGQLA